MTHSLRGLRPSTRRRCSSTICRWLRTSFSATLRRTSLARDRLERDSASRRARRSTRSALGTSDVDTRLRDLGIANKHLVAVARALVDRRPGRHHGRAHRGSVAQGGRRAVSDHRTAQGETARPFFSSVTSLRKSNASLTAMRCFATAKWSARDFSRTRAETKSSQMMVGRSVDHIFPERRHKIGPHNSQVRRVVASDRIRRHQLRTARGRDSGLLWLGRRGPKRGHAGARGVTRPSRGAVTLAAERPSRRDRRADAIEAGIVYVPEERGRQGAVIGLPIFQNISLPSLDRTSKAGVLRLAEEFALARTYAQRLDLRAVIVEPGHSDRLSGGNQQKVIIAKWLATKPEGDYSGRADQRN